MKKSAFCLFILFYFSACSVEDHMPISAIEHKIAMKLASAKKGETIAYINSDHTVLHKKNSKSLYSIQYEDKTPEGHPIFQMFYQQSHLKYSDPFIVTDATKFISDSENAEKYIEGKFTLWWENGNKQVEKHYKNGQQEGVNIAWYENGHKMLEEHYKNGQYEGPLTAWHDNGQKSVEFHYVNGQENGPSTNWYENGQKQLETQYENGQPTGTLMIWDKDGVELPIKEWPELENKNTPQQMAIVLDR